MQSWLLHILLSNAAGAALLGAVVWPISLLCRRPAVCRALWILVLIKLLAPPVFIIPVDKLLARRQASPVAIALPPPTFGEAELATNRPEVAAPIVPAIPKPRVGIISWKNRVSTVLPVLWAVGTASFLMLGIGRVFVLVRSLARAPLAPEDVQQLAHSVAARLGISKAPTVCFVPGVVCPALWAFGRTPRAIVPVSLWHRLDDQKRVTLLAHELAHLRRGDHWVRLLEFVAGVIYWWHPAVWMARRQIHDFEEQCCDAWVLWALPASAHSYGSALLEAVDFVSAARPVVPALSAGLGEFRHLKRRLLMIKQGTVSRALSRSSLLAVCGAAALALPLAPGLAQEAPPATPPPAGLPASGASSEDKPSTDPAEVARAKAEVQQAQAEVQRAQANLRQARSRLAVLEHGAAGANGNAGYGGAVGSFGGGGGFGGRSGGIVLRDGNGRAGIGNGGMDGGVGNFGPPRAGGSMTGGGGGSVSISGAGGPAGGGTVSAGGPMPPGAAGYIAAAGDAERRLEGLEDQLRQLMDQVKELRAMQQPQNKGSKP
jgi:beta-lactamase regulating signal transducer with metallopeptidase domain